MLCVGDDDGCRDNDHDRWHMILVGLASSSLVRLFLALSILVGCWGVSVFCVLRALVTANIAILTVRTLVRLNHAMFCFFLLFSSTPRALSRSFFRRNLAVGC